MKRITCGLWGKTIWAVMQSSLIATETSSTLRGEEILACIHFTNFSISQKVLWKLFLVSEIVFPLDRSTEGLVLSFLFASCPFYGWLRPGQEGRTFPGKVSAVWEEEKACSPLCPSWALPFDTSYFTFVTWKIHNDVSANSELPHSLLKNTVLLSLVAGNPPSKPMLFTLMMNTRNIFAGLTELRRISHPSSTCSTSALCFCTCVSLCVDSIGGIGAVAVQGGSALTPSPARLCWEPTVLQPRQ